MCVRERYFGALKGVILRAHVNGDGSREGGDREKSAFSLLLLLRVYFVGGFMSLMGVLCC